MEVKKWDFQIIFYNTVTKEYEIQEEEFHENVSWIWFVDTLFDHLIEKDEEDVSIIYLKHKNKLYRVFGEGSRNYSVAEVKNFNIKKGVLKYEKE